MKNPSSYLKMRVLGAIESAPGKNQQERVENVAQMLFRDENGIDRQFTWRTIYTWWYRYKHHGITGVTPSPRSDKGLTRKVSPEVLQEILNQVLPHFRQGRTNKTAIYRKAIELGLLNPQELARTTFHRILREYDLLKPESENRRRLAFAMAHANQLWQADTMFGPHIREEGRFAAAQTKLIAFLDDASRVVCHGEFYWRENTEALFRALKAAMYKRGVPEQLYVDNGGVYRCQEITLVCARLATVLCHTPVRDGAAKGKVERFFRTVRDCFLTQNLDLSSLAALNKQFFAWLEDEYNHKVHSGIGMKPIDRFGLDRGRIRYLPNLQANDELFYCEEERTVIANNTFSFRAVAYETPRLMSGKRIHIRFERGHLNTPVIVYHKGERLGEAKPVDLVANGLLRRPAILTQGSKAGETQFPPSQEARVDYRPKDSTPKHQTSQPADKTESIQAQDDEFFAATATPTPLPDSTLPESNAATPEVSP